MTNPDPTLYQLQEISYKLSLIDRNHNIPNTNLHENDVEHSYTVAILCWYILSKYSLKLDISKVLKYALIHDIAEVYAGDTNTYASNIERKNKKEREHLALSRLKKEFAGFPSFINTALAYDDQKDEEALFVWTVDKMQALILGDIDNWRPYERLSISYKQFCAKSQELLTDSSPFCKEVFSGIIEYSKSTYYDQPK